MYFRFFKFLDVKLFTSQEYHLPKDSATIFFKLFFQSACIPVFSTSPALEKSFDISCIMDRSLSYGWGICMKIFFCWWSASPLLEAPSALLDRSPPLVVAPVVALPLVVVSLALPALPVLLLLVSCVLLLWCSSCGAVVYCSACWVVFFLLPAPLLVVALNLVIICPL